METCILSSMKQITSPGWMHETGARGWCTGKTQRDQVEREVGGGIGMGNTCKPMADSCQCMQKLLQYCKIISLQLIKVNGKKKKKHCLSKRPSGEGNGNPLQCPFLENPRDRGAWWAAIYGVAQSWT